MSEALHLKTKTNTQKDTLNVVEPRPDLLSALLSMGFPVETASHALIQTNNQNIPAALDWLEKNPNWSPSPIDPADEDRRLREQILKAREEEKKRKEREEKEKDKLVSRFDKYNDEKKAFFERQRQKEIEKSRQEKMAAKLQKERLLQQVEEDKKKRLARTNQNQPATVQQPANPPTPIPKPSTQPQQFSRCSLQIRLPQGKVLKAEFDPEDTLSTVHAYVKQNLDQEMDFDLIIPFPRKEFTEEMMNQKLKETELAPRGTLTVLPSINKGIVKQAPSIPVRIGSGIGSPPQFSIQPTYPLAPPTLDSDRMSYEDLLDLENRIGTVSKGLSLEQLALLPTMKYQGEEKNKCLICQGDYALGDSLRILPCEHNFHVECVDCWLRDNNTCPLCKALCKVKIALSPHSLFFSASQRTYISKSAFDADQSKGTEDWKLVLAQYHGSNPKSFSLQLEKLLETETGAFFSEVTLWSGFYLIAGDRLIFKCNQKELTTSVAPGSKEACSLEFKAELSEGYDVLMLEGSSCPYKLRRVQ
eukprot:TRINITY_DN1712_c0_g1_i1.p1 TRINITY_DN1712_c0_g1~~TRINITY_DN1712_c0_g1_i1.p1  ORF type:complete len:531 (+),score=119.59 TRINITY_DN1712_c0_g1_i1:32-1624(+)